VEPSNSIPSSAHVSDTGKADSSEWFYSQLGDVYGPVSTADLCAAAHLGFLLTRGQRSGDAAERAGPRGWLSRGGILDGRDEFFFG